MEDSEIISIFEILVISLNLDKMAKKKEEQEVEEKKSRTQLALEKLNKDYGAGTAMTMNESPHKDLDVISTGSLKIDMATGVGGLPRGRIVEILGWESSGKTTIAEGVIAEAQKRGLGAALIDGEHAYDPIYGAALGIDNDKLIISQPDYGEQGLAVAESLIETGEFGVIVIDSVSALVPKKEIEGEMGDSTIGLQSRMMGQAMRKLTAITSKNNTLLIFINQLREKIGVMFGSPETTSGGNALRFYASIRIDVRKSLDLVNELNTTKIKIIKNKVAPPFGTAKIDVLWGKGYDKVGEVLDLAGEMGIIQRGGAGWYTIGEQKIQGDEALRALMEDNPEFYEETRQKVLEGIKNGYKSPRELPKEK